MDDFRRKFTEKLHRPPPALVPIFTYLRRNNLLRNDEIELFPKHEKSSKIGKISTFDRKSKIVALRRPVGYPVGASNPNPLTLVLGDEYK